MSSLTFTFGWTLLHFVWQGTAIALSVWLILAFARRSRPELRYAIACAGFVLMALVPLVTFVVLRRTEPPPVTQMGPERSATHSGVVEGPPLVRTLDSSPAISKPASRRSFRGSLDVVAPWLMPLWACGVLVLGLRLAGGAGWLYKARRRSRPLEGLWSERLDTLRKAMGLGRAVALRILDNLEGPVVVGYLKPVILVPASVLTGLPATQVELLLAHELAHIARHDFIANLLQRLIETMLFFHPAVWWLSKCIRRERERCCDAMAADLLGDPCGMAEALTSLEDLRITAPMPAFAMGAIGLGDAEDPLKARVQALLDLHSPVNRARLAIVAGLLLVCVGSGAVLWRFRHRHWPALRAMVQPQVQEAGRVHYHRDQTSVEISFSVDNTTAEEVLAAFSRIEARLGQELQVETDEPIHRPNPRGVPPSERHSVGWQGPLSRAQFLEYWYRLKARPRLDTPADAIVVRRDNLSLPWDSEDEPPLDIWVPKHADEFSVEAARLVREAILELKAKPATQGLPQEARRRLPESVLSTLKSPDPGEPILRCSDKGLFAQIAKRAEEPPFAPTGDLEYTQDFVRVEDLAVPTQAERRMLATKRAAIEAHRHSDRWGLLRSRNRRPARALNAQAQKEVDAWRKEEQRLQADYDAENDNLRLKGLQLALKKMNARLGQLAVKDPKPLEHATDKARHIRLELDVPEEEEDAQPCLKIWGLRQDPGLLRQDPLLESRVLRVIETVVVKEIEGLQDRIRARSSAAPLAQPMQKNRPA